MDFLRFHHYGSLTKKIITPYESFFEGFSDVGRITMGIEQGWYQILVSMTDLMVTLSFPDFSDSLGCMASISSTGY